LQYNHLYLVDSFYASPNNPNEKIRVTRNEKTGEVSECMRKMRLGDLNIYSPKCAADWRVTVNLEIPGKSEVPPLPASLPHLLPSLSSSN